MIDGYRPKPGDEQKFREKHLVAVNKSLGGKATEDDNVFNASNVKTVDREKERHGHNPDKSDEKVYEQKMTNKVCKDCGCDYGNPEPGCDCKHDCKDASGSNWVSKSTVKEEIAESKTSDALYKQHCDRVETILKQLRTAVDTHKKNVMQGTSHYGHVQDMNSFANQLQDLHDRMSMQGEYAKPIQLAAVKESVEQVDEQPSKEKIRKVMREFKKGKLHSGKGGPIVTDEKQALAIALNQETDYQHQTLSQMLEAFKPVSITTYPHPTEKGFHIVYKSSDHERIKPGDKLSLTRDIQPSLDDKLIKHTVIKPPKQTKQSLQNQYNPTEELQSVAEGVLRKIKKATRYWAQMAVTKTANQQLGPAGAAAVQYLMTPEKK